MKLQLKKYLKSTFPKIYQILETTFKNRYENVAIFNQKIQFKGWGLAINHAPPWVGSSKNKTYVEFNKAEILLQEKIKNKSFNLSQYKNIYRLNYRHYILFYTAMIAFNNTKSRNIVECGVADGLTIFFAINKFKESTNYKVYLYDSWKEIKKEYLDEDREKEMIGLYEHISIENTKKNLLNYKDNIYFNQGYIPDSFQKNNGPNELSWLHIDLNSSKPTLDSLEYFYPKLEKNGIILFDDYSWNGYEKTRELIEIFLEDKEGEFLHLPTGQAFFVKKTN